MPINPINESLWPEIFELQSRAYMDIEPESLEVLRDKWLHSPHCCFVFQNEDNKISAYLLAHVWGEETPPKLYQPLCEQNNCSSLFLHDLAVSASLNGSGLGKQMVQRLISIAKQHHYQQIQLVAIQGSVPFWQKTGFIVDKSQLANECYGEGAKVMKQIV